MLKHLLTIVKTPADKKLNLGPQERPRGQKFKSQVFLIVSVYKRQSSFEYRIKELGFEIWIDFYEQDNQMWQIGAI